MSERLAEYLDSNYLYINLTKTKYMIFDSPRGNIHKHYKGSVLYEYVELERVVNIKFLGVIINNKLDWSNQINMVARSLTSLSGVLYNLRKFVSF